jgi:putative ATPase
MADQLFPPDETEPAHSVFPGHTPPEAVGRTPLAARMRPRSLDELVGQEHVLGEGSALRTAIEQGRPFSMVLYGPPGTGKTTLARIVASSADAAFEELSAVNAGKAEVRGVIERAAERRRGGRPTIFFLDEIHRFNKAQQDALLPAVEDGLVTLIGATTENPYFEVNSALLSRAQIIELETLDPGDVEVLLRRAFDRGECGAHGVSDDVFAFLASRTGGDARAALTALEVACETTDGEITMDVAEDALRRRAVRYDKTGDQHYDYISALIKSMRGSDPDAAIYYLVVMLEGGEDPRYLARRMIVLASEDIGNADPHALPLAIATAQAVEHVGAPECSYALAQCAMYLALAPKSNSTLRALAAARRHVQEHGAQLPPDAIRSAAYPGARALGRGQGYDYPHERPEKVSPQELLPDNAAGERFVELDATEPELRDRLQRIREARHR